MSYLKAIMPTGNTLHGAGRLRYEGRPDGCALCDPLKDVGAPLGGSLMLQSVIGEEDGGLGTFATLLRGHRGDAAIVCEARLPLLAKMSHLIASYKCGS